MDKIINLKSFPLHLYRKWVLNYPSGAYYRLVFNPKFPASRYAFVESMIKLFADEDTAFLKYDYENFSEIPNTDYLDSYYDIICVIHISKHNSLTSEEEVKTEYFKIYAIDNDLVTTTSHIQALSENSEAIPYDALIMDLFTITIVVRTELYLPE